MIRYSPEFKQSLVEMHNQGRSYTELAAEYGGADVKIMDRFFRHREVPDSENFSKPGFQLKTA